MLQEQLDYLIAHAVECARPECPDCERYKRAREVLLAPFNEPPRPRKPQQAAPADQERIAAVVAKWRYLAENARLAERV